MECPWFMHHCNKWLQHIWAENYAEVGMLSQTNERNMRSCTFIWHYSTKFLCAYLLVLHHLTSVAVLVVVSYCLVHRTWYESWVDPLVVYTNIIGGGNILYMQKLTRSECSAQQKILTQQQFFLLLFHIFVWSFHSTVD
jgi:hypothetical protein